MNKELEEMIEIYINARDNKSLIESIYPEFFFEFVDMLLNYIENSIPKQIVDERQNELQKEYEEALEENSTKAFILKCKLEMIKELLDESNI